MNRESQNPIPLDLNVPLVDSPSNNEPLFDLNFPQMDFKETQVIDISSDDSNDENSPDSPSGFVNREIDFLAVADSSQQDVDEQENPCGVSRKINEKEENPKWGRRKKRTSCRCMDIVEVPPLWGETEEDAEVFTEALKVVVKRGGEVNWVPKRNEENWREKIHVPSLKELCLRVLEDNAEEVDSLEGLTDAMKETLVSIWCGKRRMSKHVLGLYLTGSCTEVRVGDCSWIGEEDMEDILRGLNHDKLKVLQLDLCGRCIPSFVLQATLAKFPNSLPSLTTVCLVGAYRLSDDGLNVLATSAPLLSSVNLSKCSLLTSDGIINLAEKLRHVLRKLYLDDCQAVDAMLILRALWKLRSLETLSVSRIHNVCDEFVFNVVTSDTKELGIADCQKLTAASMRALSLYCPQLCALDIRNLNRLSEFALRHLTSGCRSIQKLKLQRNKFSDEAIAAFLEASGGSLIELSLNNIAEANPNLKEYINKPLKWFDELAIIVGDDHATGSFSRSAWDDIPSEEAERPINLTEDEDIQIGVTQVESQDEASRSKGKKPSSSRAPRPKKAQRNKEKEDETKNIMAVVKEVSVAIQKASIGWSAQLADKVHEVGGKYSDEFIDTAVEYLYENRKQGKLFVIKTRHGREKWMADFAVKNGVVASAATEELNSDEE